jgi:hypothetical protein
MSCVTGRRSITSVLTLRISRTELITSVADMSSNVNRRSVPPGPCRSSSWCCGVWVRTVAGCAPNGPRRLRVSLSAFPRAQASAGAANRGSRGQGSCWYWGPFRGSVWAPPWSRGCCSLRSLSAESSAKQGGLPWNCHHTLYQSSSVL